MVLYEPRHQHLPASFIGDYGPKRYVNIERYDCEKKRPVGPDILLSLRWPPNSKFTSSDKESAFCWTFAGFSFTALKFFRTDATAFAFS